MQDYDYITGDGWGDVEINGERMPKKYWPKSDDGPTESYLKRKGCPYCSWPIIASRANRNHRNGDESRWDIVHCRNCSFWQFAHEFLHIDTPVSGLEWAVYSAIARVFEGELPVEVASEAAIQLRRNAGRWSQIDPKSLEKLITSLFRLNFQDCEVMHVGRPGDGGVDVLFIDSDEKTWLVQIKRRGKGGSEGVNTIRNLLGVMLVKDVPRGIVVSTADYFSFHCYRECQLAYQRGFEVKLVDRGKINRMLSPAIPRKPWRGALSEELPREILRKMEQQLATCEIPNVA